MSFGITVNRAISDAQVTFTASLTTADEALSIATLLATGAAPAPTAKQESRVPEKNVVPAVKDAPVEQTPAASASSANSSTGSPEASGFDKAPPALDYQKDIKPLVLGIAKISREKIEALLQRFGVATAKVLPADQYPAFKDLADKVLSGEYDPLASDEGAIA